jgi:hypothetical protein
MLNAMAFELYSRRGMGYLRRTGADEVRALVKERKKTGRTRSI